MNHPSAPVGSIELLLSPSETWAPPGGQPVPVEVPSAANVVAAFDRWYARCNSHPDNVALLYFCGHGVERESQYLLLEDFGESDLRLLENAVDIGATYLGMAKCRAVRQYFFIDACRDIPYELVNQLSGNAKILVDPEFTGDPRHETGLMFATSGGSAAYGKPGEVTRFTHALIRALDGLGGRPDGRRWLVAYPDVQRAVTVLLNADKGAPPQRPTWQGAGLGVLHELAGPPVVRVGVSCDPAAAVPGALASLGAAGQAPAPGVASQEGWQFDVPADFYVLTIDFPNGGYQRQEERIAAFPPQADARVTVAP